MMRQLPEPMTWLASGVPLTLLVDLLDPQGPDSRAIYGDEPATATWLQHAADAA